jgi:hypothetical protein
MCAVSHLPTPPFVRNFSFQTFNRSRFSCSASRRASQCFVRAKAASRSKQASLLRHPFRSPSIYIGNRRPNSGSATHITLSTGEAPISMLAIQHPDVAKLHRPHRRAMPLKRNRRPSTVAEPATRPKRLRATDIPPSGPIDPRLQQFLAGPRDWRNLHRSLSSRGRALPQDQQEMTYGGPPMLLEPIQLQLYAYGEA